MVSVIALDLFELESGARSIMMSALRGEGCQKTGVILDFVWIPKINVGWTDCCHEGVAVLLYLGGPARFITGHFEDLNLVKVYNRIV